MTIAKRILLVLSIAVVFASAIIVAAQDVTTQQLLDRIGSETPLTPFPTMEFDRDRGVGFDSLILDNTAFAKDDHGTNPYSPWSVGSIISPEMFWAQSKGQAAIEFWSEKEFDDHWLGYEIAWSEFLPITFSLDSKDIGAVATSGLWGGDISRFVLETSTGYQHVISENLPSVSPDLDLNDLKYPYSSTFVVMFPQEALKDRPDWIRVYLIVGGNRVVFEWNFE